MLIDAMNAAVARRRATRLLRPYAERAAWAGGPLTEADWLTSRCIGFLAGAINRIVAQDNLEEEGFLAVQLGVWEDLTCAAPGLFATRLYLLSSEGDLDIREGHIAGAHFADALLSGEEEAARAAWDMSLGDLGSGG